MERSIYEMERKGANCSKDNGIIEIEKEYILKKPKAI